MKNLVILIGRVGKQPEIRHLESGNSVANFSLATSESFKDKNTGERKETTTWHNIVIWGNLCKVVENYVNKGDLLYVEGKITNRSWEKDGVTKWTTEIVVSNMTMLGGNQSQSNQNQTQQQEEIQGPDGEGDLPF